MEPFDIYKKKVGRFASEYGFQGFPERSTLAKVIDTKDLVINSDPLKCHEKHPTGFETIKTYLEREYKLPKYLNDYIYISQLLQAYGIKTAIEAHRNAKPRCMGSLYWQFNDCWPVVSWSATDYYHNPKAIQYFVKKAFNNILVTLEQNGDKIEVNVNSDKLESTSAQLELKLVDFTGKVSWQQKKSIIIKANSNNVTDKIDTKMLLADTAMQSSMVFYACIKVNDKIVSDNYLYFKKNKDLTLPNPEISYQIDSLSDRYSINIRTQKLAKNIFVRFENREGAEIPLSDNFFDLLPNSSVQVFATTKESLTFLKSHIRISSLFDIK
jgi:beta-mannosidase